MIVPGLPQCSGTMLNLETPHVERGFHALAFPATPATGVIRERIRGRVAQAPAKRQEPVHPENRQSGSTVSRDQSSARTGRADPGACRLTFMFAIRYGIRFPVTVYFQPRNSDRCPRPKPSTILPVSSNMPIVHPGPKQWTKPCPPILGQSWMRQDSIPSRCSRGSGRIGKEISGAVPSRDLLTQEIGPGHLNLVEDYLKRRGLEREGA
jgi:hypothetical protein